MSLNQPKILIVDPQEIIAYGLDALLKRTNCYRSEIAECIDIEEVLNAVNLVRPKLLIVNPLITGMRIDTALTNKLEGMVIALLYENMRNLPLVGYRQSITTDSSIKEIVDAIDSLLIQDKNEEEKAEEKALSPRETDVVILVAKGMTNKEIAHYLSLSIHTVITHRRNIARKLDIHSVSGITIYAIMNQLVTLEETNMK